MGIGLSIALTIVGSILFDMYMDRHQPVPPPLPPKVQQMEEIKKDSLEPKQTVPYTKSQVAVPKIPDPFEGGYHDGYNGKVAPGKWALLHRYRLGYYAGQKDFKEGRPNRYTKKVSVE